MAPWKCPDCGTWWSGLEHRCQPSGVGTGMPPVVPWVSPLGGVPNVTTGGTTLHCTCPDKRGDNYVGHCPIHDTLITYT